MDIVTYDLSDTKFYIEDWSYGTNVHPIGPKFSMFTVSRVKHAPNTSRLGLSASNF